MRKQTVSRKGAFFFNILGILDPLTSSAGSYNLHHDTSHLLLLEFQRRGHTIFLTDPSKLEEEGSQLIVRAQKIQVKETSPYFELDPEKIYPSKIFHLMLMRKDPPVDQRYLQATHLLSLAPKSTWVANAPQALREWNEKLVILNFPHWIPPTLVTSNAQRILEFLHKQGGAGIAKSLSGFAGRGVSLLSLCDAEKIVSLTDQGQTLLMVQPFLKKVHEGEKRIFIVDGRPLGAILKIPAEGTFLANPDFGARLLPTDLTQREKKLCQELAPFFKKKGIFFAGIDTINGLLIEINITSPGLLWEWNLADGQHHEREIVDLFEQQLKKRRT